MPPYQVVSVYFATRTLGLALLLPGSLALMGLVYARLALQHFGSVQGLWEYPWPMAALLQIPLRMGAESQTAYLLAWSFAAVLIDAAFAVLLWHAGGRRPTPGLWLWLGVLPALGPLVLMTSDIVPAVLTAAALLAAAAARPTVGAGLLAFAGALKLWPLAGLPALVLPTDARQRGRLIAAFVAVCAVLGCATIAEGGMQRLLSPFAWQQARGLQVEALAALPFLWARLLDGAGGWTIVMSRFNCYEVQGPGVDRALAWSMIAMLLGLLGAALMYLRAFRSVPGVRTPALAIRLLLLTVLILLITNKAFSPQYLVWLAAPLAVLGVLRPWPLERVDSVLFLAGCVLTQVVYPLNYAALVAQDGPVLWVLGALTLRDVLLIVLGARLAVQAWRMSAREQ